MYIILLCSVHNIIFTCVGNCPQPWSTVRKDEAISVNPISGIQVDEEDPKWCPYFQNWLAFWGPCDIEAENGGAIDVRFSEESKLSDIIPFRVVKQTNLHGTNII